MSLPYELCDSLMFSHRRCGNETAGYLTWGGGGGGGGGGGKLTTLFFV